MIYDTKKIIKALNEHVETGYRQAGLIDPILAAVARHKIRVRKVADDYYTFDDHKGDCFDPTINTDIDPKALKRQERNERARFNRQGAFYSIAEYWTGRTWVETDLIGGFVGDDFIGSGYEYDLLSSAIEAYNQQDLDEAGYVIDPYRRLDG